MKKHHLLWLIFIWLLGGIISFSWNYSLVISNNKEVVLNKSRTIYEQILVTRAWNVLHGGVYVPGTKTTPPNPYLRDSLRDIETTAGMKLSKIDPSFMTRQLAEINQLKYGFNFHITSLNPLRPANKADRWETKAHELFEQGAPELLELVSNDSSAQYRYMVPLIIDQSCLKCHSHQGYKNGDIRGGISVSFPSLLYAKGINQQLFSLGVIHFFILVMGIISLLAYYLLTKKYILALNNKNLVLGEANAIKDKLFSIIAHDLRGPMQSLSSLLIMAKDDFVSEAEFKKYIPELMQNVEANRQLLDNLLNWSNRQLNNATLNRKPFYINSLINNNMLLIEKQAKSKNISVIFDDEKKIAVYADKDMIDLVVRNLFANSLKFTHEQGSIKVSFTESESEVVVHIIDDGEGISEDHIKKIFGSEIVSTRGTKNEKGIGLGLRLCKDFIEKNSGTIDVKSSRGKGSDFYFSIPKSN